MAKKYDKHQLVADHRAGGYTQRELAHKYDISVAMVSKLTKGVPKDLVNIVNAKVATNQALAIADDEEANAIEHEVNKRMKLLGGIQKFSTRAIEKAASMLDAVESGRDLKDIVDAVDKVSVTNSINERHARPTQIQNNQQNNHASMSLSDVEREISAIEQRTR